MTADSQEIRNDATTTGSSEKPPPAGRSRRRLAWWKKAGFGVVVTVVFFAALEAILAAFGVRPLLYDQDPYVGFSSTIPLFVEKMGSEGVMLRVTADNRLRLFNKQEFPVEKEPGTYRIFCLGGSTTYGRPYNDMTSFAGWLREFLPAADPSRRWEVINAGGISYASYRVALLMEELVRYEPDLFIVYSGQNEFLETRTYRSVLDTPPLVRNLYSRLAATRTFSVFERLLKHDDQETPEISTDARDMLPAEVVAVLDRTVGPQSYHRGDFRTDQVLDHYRYSLERMIAFAHSAGADIVFVTPACNLRDFEPFKSEHRDDLELASRDLWLGLVEQSGDAFDAGRFDEALEALDKAAAIDDRYARLHFLRGRVLLRLQRDAEAKVAFERARDEDVCPLRALTPMRGIVRDVAARHGVPCVDFVGMIERQSEHGIPGNDWFLDHVHPKIEGHRLLALEVLEEIESLEGLSLDESWGPAAIEEVTRRVQGRLDSRSHANALRNLAKVLRWAGKFDEASQLSILAVQGLPGDVEAHVMAGDAYWRQGQLDAAEAEYLLAVSLDSNDLWALMQLGSVLLAQGQPQAALNYLRRAAELADDRADPHFRLANALYVLKDLDGAETEYRKTLRLAPDWAEAHKNLALIAIAQDDIDAAVSHYEQALTIDPEDATTHCELGWLMFARGETASAREEFSLAALLDPRLVRAYLGLAELARARGDDEQAAEMDRRARELDPSLERKEEER